MSNRVFAVALFMFLAISVSAIIVHAQDPASSDEDIVGQGVTSHGVVHNIAADRLVEKIGGVYQPEGIDKYMKRKFDAMSAKIDELQAKIDQLNTEVQKFSANPNREASSGALVS